MKKTAFLIIIILAFWGCSTFSQNYKIANEAALSKNWDKAIEYYEKALAEDPSSSVYRLALLRAKVVASYVHSIEARKLASQGKKEEAMVEYEKALSYDPLNRAIIEELETLTLGEAEEEKPKEIRLEPPVKLKVSEEKIQLRFPIEAPLRSIFQALGKHAQINIIFDEQFRDVPFSIDLTDMSFEQTVKSLCLASKNFYRIIDEGTIIIAPDQPLKRAQYELNAIKTFYLSNIMAEDIRGPLLQMLRTQFRAPNIIINANLNSVTVRDTPSVVELAQKIIQVWDKAKGEVIVDLEIMEVSRVKIRQIGLDFQQYLFGLRYKGAGTSGDSNWTDLKGIDFSKSENFQISLPTSFLQILESDVDTKIIAQPRLRGVENEVIEYMVGDQIPVPRATFTPIAAGGISQQPVVNYDYKDIGIDIKITPKIHFEKEITLELEIKIKSLAGTGYADLPIITTREVKNIIRLKDGETNLLAGLLKDEERKTVRGIAGLKSIPLLGGLFSRTDQSIQQTDVILTITPYIIRTVSLTEEDLKPLWVGVEGISHSRRTVRDLPREDLDERRLRQRAEREERARIEESVPNSIFLSPANLEIPQNREFRINMNMRSQEEIGSLSLNISFNAGVLKLKEIVERGFFDRLGEKAPTLKNIDNNSGICTIGYSSPEIGKGIRGTGSVATLVFETTGKGESIISITSITANSPTGEDLSFESRQSRVVVR